MNQLPSPQPKSSIYLTGHKLLTAVTSPKSQNHQNPQLHHKIASSLTSQAFFNTFQKVNYHHQSSIPKFIKDHTKIPSIVSSVFYLQKNSKQPEECKVYKFKGGGFKGKIAKNKRIRSLLPTIRIENQRLVLKKNKSCVKFLKRKKTDNKIFRTASIEDFKESVSGRRLGLDDIDL